MSEFIRSPWPGNWYPIFLTAKDFTKCEGGTPNPAAPSEWANSWGAPYYDSANGWSFGHPTSSGNGWCGIEANVQLPLDCAEGAVGQPLQIAADLLWTTTGASSAYNVRWGIYAKSLTLNDQTFNGVAWNTVSGGLAPQAGGWTGFVVLSLQSPIIELPYLGRTSILQFQVRREYSGDTWPHEAILLGALVMIRIY